MRKSEPSLVAGGSSWFGWSGSLHGVIELAAELGVDANPVLESLKLQDALRDPKGRAVPTHLIMRALGELIRLSGLESFPARLADRQSIDMLGSLADRLLDQPNLGIALAEASRLQHWRGTGFLLLFEQGEDTAVLSLQTLLPDPDMAKIQQDYVLAFVVNIVRAMLGAAWSPDAVQLARPRPRALVDTSTWLTQMGCPVRFDAEIYAIIFDKGLLNSPIAYRESRKRTMHSLEPHMLIGWPELVDREIIRQSSVGRVTLPSVAAAMGLSARHLQRHLGKCGTTYQTRLDAIRAERARRFLLDHRLSMTELSVILGYNDPAIFTRSFRRWYGISPRTWRKAALAQTHYAN